MLYLMRIEQATGADGPEIQAMLEKAGLPVEDLSTAPVRFWLAREEQSLAGAIGIERYGSAGLLRSLAVDPGHQGLGTGSALVQALELAMHAEGLKTIVLLTQTAESFFARRGYVLTPREQVPEPIRQTAEFRSLCPATAVCMSRAL
jgi:N-acetylglutamate synthase-like GNAT family acetyltransferase